MTQILVVEDSKTVQYSILTILRKRGYFATAVNNGELALEYLSTQSTPPDIILSDITMPKMDGYALYLEIIKKPKWTKIPFIFLTARNTRQNIRFGKKLGVDDYITKPIDEEDLLASIEGNLIKVERNHQFQAYYDSENLTQKSEVLKNSTKPIASSPEEVLAIDIQNFSLLYMDWNDILGPVLLQHHPKSIEQPNEIAEVGIQLYNTSSAIYGHQNSETGQGVLLHATNFDTDAVIYFDCIPDQTMRGNAKLIMLGVLAPKIAHLTNLRIQETLAAISRKIKGNQAWNIERYWNQIHEYF